MWQRYVLSGTFAHQMYHRRVGGGADDYTAEIEHKHKICGGIS